MGMRGTGRRTSRVGRAQAMVRWALGGGLVGVGAMVGAFGTIAWLFVLRVPSVSVVLLGMLFLGAAPLGMGLGLLWAGLSVIENEIGRARVWTISEEQIVEAAGKGTPLTEMVIQLGGTDLRETEKRLDDLVVRDVLSMDITEQGEIVYRQPVSLDSLN